MARLLAVAPVVFVFPALGFDGLRRLPGAIGKRVRWPAMGLAVASVVWLSTQTFTLYFGKWAHSAGAYWASDGNATPLAALLNTRSEQNVFLSLAEVDPIRLLVPRSGHFLWFSEINKAIPIASKPSGSTLYVLSKDAAIKGSLSRMLTGLQALPHATDPAGNPAYYSFLWPRADAQRESERFIAISGTMKPTFDLVGYRVQESSRGAVLDLLWRPLVSAGFFDAYVHLIDVGGHQITQSDDLLVASPIDRAHPYLWMTQHTLGHRVGKFDADVGIARRSAAYPWNVVGGTIGDVVRIPIVFSAH